MEEKNQMKKDNDGEEFHLQRFTEIVAKRKNKHLVICDFRK